MLTTTLESPPPYVPIAPIPAARSVQPAPHVPASTLVSAHLEDIQHAVRTVARQRNLRREEADELSSVVFIRLLERDGAILRQFRGDSTAVTFLVVVVRRILLDVWIAKHGRWRPSAEALQMGEVAVHLEHCVYREGMPFREAAETVRLRLGVPDSDDELGFLLSLLPQRPPRRFIGDDCLARMATREPSALDRLIQASAPARGAALARALRTLDTQDRRLVRLRFQRNLTVAEIAQLIGTEPKRLYRQFDRLLRQLRTEMERQAA